MMPRKLLIGVSLGLLVITINSAIVNAHSCYRCEGLSCEDPEIVECSEDADNGMCYMRFENNQNNVNQMGCLSDISEGNNIIELIKKKALLVCDGSNCNGYENLPQFYQCTECSSSEGEACATKPKTLTKQKLCRNIPYTQCYQRVIGNVTERGCLNDLEDDEFYTCLTDNSDKCKVCKGDGCNEDIIPSDRRKCQRCSSDADTLCQTSPVALSVCPSYNETDRCVAVLENGITRRGCKTEFTCDIYSKNCQICSEDGCNTANIQRRFEDLFGIFQDLPLNCYTCSGEDCEPGNPLKPHKCEGDSYQDCITVFDANGKVLRRGCEFAVLAEHQSHCDSHPELCFKCKSNGCNDVVDHSVSQECLYCDAATNPDCLFNPSSITTTRKCAFGCVASLYPRKSNPKTMDFVRTCFEDIEPDDRDSCTAENNCVKCLDNKCNTDILPSEGRLSCLHCEGADCETPQSKTCVGYRPNELCYMYFDNITLSVVAMGCRSDITDQQLKAEIKQFFVCDGDNCNNYNNLPEAKFCALCDSSTDVNCAVAPSRVTNQTRCGNYPYTECYTRIRDDGHTERGCLSSLPTDIFISCHDGNPNSYCRICTDDNCNKNIYPSSRQRCHRCDSSSDPNCEDEPNTLQACPIYQTPDACVTQWVDGITRRGCASEMSCKGLGRKNCRSCSYTGCNDINLASEDIGEVGIFTDLPLSCLHCNGTENCSLSTLGELSTCNGNIDQTCSTAFDQKGNVVARGCSDSLESICEDEDNICFDCKSNGCNIAQKESEFIDCIYCDAKNGDDCTFKADSVKRTRKCYKSCMTSLYPRTKDEHPVYELIRSCLDDKDKDDRNNCESSLDPKCKSCSGKKCNTDDLGSRKSCYQCKGDECQIPKNQTCRAVMDQDQCFVQWDETGSITEMGCKSQYDPEDVNILIKAKQLWLCDDDNCNHFDNLPKSQTCVLCNSRTDSKCSITPSNVTSSTTCGKEPYTQCYSRVLEDGHTERGCLSNLEGDEFLDCLYNKNSNKCLPCVGSKCNQEAFPSDRLSCHVCSSTSSASCESSPNNSQICLLYFGNDKCVSSLDVNGNTVRGCASQLSCDSSNFSSCQECEGDSCNVANLKRKSDGKPGQWQLLPLTCLSCNNLKDCATNSSQQLCSDSEYCMTVFDNNEKVVRRGCSNSVEHDKGVYCDLNSSNCFNCNSNKCNNATSLSSYVDCLYCDSATNHECALNPSAIGNRRKCNGGCMTALYSLSNSSTYELVRTCLDDKEAVDQIACATGNSTECKACSGSDCNTHKLPESRLSCFHCEDENCEDPNSSECLKYNSNDQCYMLFNNLSNIIQMGCLSELDNEFVSNNSHLLYTCSAGDDCNNFENLPKPNLCAVCNSNDDENCASNPDNVPSVAKCSAFPNTQCFTKVNKGGSTQRGCLNSLDPIQILSCLSGNDSLCTLCEGDRCNIEIFPVERRSCHRCNSKDNPNCESSPDFSQVCPVYSSNQYCATKLVNGHTYRGCSTEFQCDDSDKQYCRSCYDSDNCNVVDLVSSSIGHPGSWQEIPISCYTCKNEECQNENLGAKQLCSNNNEQNCGTVFAQNGSVVERGCSDLIYGGEYLNYCDNNPGYCKFCKSNECNLATSLADYGDCLFCDGVSNAECVSNPENISRTRSCHKGCMTGLYPRKDEQNPAYELARGCLDDLELVDRETCQAGKKPYCQACSGSSCNNARIPERRLTCNVCNGADCDELKSAECTSFRENDKCFAWFNEENNVKRMGCASDLDNDELEAGKRHILLCVGDNCNNFDNFPQSTSCRWCNSVDNPECATKPSTSTATVCHLFPNTECFTRVDEDGVTHRGCLSDVEDDMFADCISGNSTSCEVCSTNNCNNEIYPEGRRSCVQCDSAIFPGCEDNAKDFVSICPLYAENDKCVTKLEGERTIRGCASEVTCDTADRDTCRVCNSTDNCNTVNLLLSYVGKPGIWQELPLNCYHCEGEECTSGNGVLNKCEGNNLQICMTVFNSEGTVVKRGCSDDVDSTHSDYCNENSDKCFECKSNGCNNVKNLNDYVDCYFCDSANKKNCSINFDASKTKTRKCHKSCMVALYPRTSANDPSYELSRSCLDDLEEDDRKACANGDKELCKACDGSRCNVINVPEERFECYKCIDNDCEDMESQQCNSYHANDQCYTLYDNESSIIGAGCRSEFEVNDATELVKQKKLLLCNEKNCNDPSSLPKPKFCSVCNSAENPLCATNPNLVDNIKRCASLPYTECFTRVNSYNHTERGCLGSLEDAPFYGCLMNTDGLCETCAGDKCNEIDVFPSDRRKCHQCSSAFDNKCASKPDSNKVCEIYHENDYCVTNFRDGITTRGCASSMKCDDEKDPLTCRLCSGDGCNTINMEKIVDEGVPGRWQDIPITCYTCEGEEDCEHKGDLRSCQNNPLQNCMTVFNNEGKVKQRGCSDSVDSDNKSYCEENPDKCLRCNSNGCNVATKLEEYVECLYCDSDTNGNCVSNVTGIKKVRQCYKRCMTALYRRFEEENPSYGLSRSCYDDMDLDDRELCEAGKKEYCQACSGAKCNIIDMPQKRHSCYICEGDDCQIPKTRECPSYRADDKCYIRFDERNAIVSFGCRSEFSNTEADYLLKQKRLHLCEGENCNHFDTLPSEQTCALCNSRTDKNCSVNPSEVTSQTNCKILPITECYSRVLSDGATERGCLSSLYDDEFLGCFNGTSTTCKSCKGNNCNKDVFPESRLKCHVCDSSIDPSCEDTPNSLNICPKYDAEDTCVTVYRNDVTYRDCSSSLLCDVTNPRTCVKCSGEGCNTVNLAKKQDDNFGKWQDLPLTCLNCTGSDCSSTTKTNSLKCELNNEQDCMTVFDKDGKVTRRGCADIVESEYKNYCDKNGENCFSCKSNNCNNATAKSDYTECIYCNSYKDQDCVWNPLSSAHKTRKCKGGCMTALYPSDISATPAYDLIRTCLDDKEVKDQNKCSGGKDANCNACTGKNCNTDIVPASRVSCYTCRNESCIEPASKLCPLYKENDQCFIRFDDTNSVSEMGCVSSFRNQDIVSIIKTKRVHVCQGSNCNTLENITGPKSCAVCSSKDDKACAVNPLQIGTFKTCNMFPYTSCYSKLTNAGITERGCLTDLPANNFTNCVLGNDKNCGICDENGCNREIFPAGRQQCFTCTSEEESECESFPTTKMPCPIVNEKESCVTALSGNVTVRGCKSSIYCDANDSKTCRFCFGSECNSIDLLNKQDDEYHGVWQDLPLKCHTCVGEHCLHSLGPTVTCSQRNINQDCMTVFDDLGYVERRGCSDDVEDYKDLYCRLHPERCFKCKSNECNIAWSMEEYVNCTFCNSSIEPFCVLNPDDNGLKARACYKKCMVAMKDQEIIRSCLDDKEVWVQHQCELSGSKECAACSGSNCNKFTFPEDRLKCHVCNGSSCTSSITQNCELYKSGDYCFAKYENGVVDKMGCASSQNATDLEKWSAEKKLYKCEGNDCNQLALLPKNGVCISCDSSKTTNCAQNPLQVNTTETCLAPNDQCYTTVNQKGHTIRGCLSNVEDRNCEATGTCDVCRGEKCNNQIYPANRLKCHICNSVSDKNCVRNPSNVQVCPIYDKEDRCVSTLGNDGLLTRGCASQIKCSTVDSNYCDICNTNGCNTVELSGSATVAANSLLLTLLLAFVSALALKF